MSDSLKSQILELASHMRKQPQSIDSKIVHVGKRCLSIFHDSNFGPTIPNYIEMMRVLYLETIVDLANGAPMLSYHTLGLNFRNGKLARFSVPFSQPHSLGTVVCSINLKSRKAFEKHLNEEASSLTQDEINGGVYFLTFMLSGL